MKLQLSHLLPIDFALLGANEKVSSALSSLLILMHSLD